MILKIILLLLAVYIVFIVMPSAVCAAIAFARQRSVPMDRDGGAPMKGTQYESFAEEILRDIAAFRAMPKERICLTADDGTALAAEWIRGEGTRTAILVHGYCASPEANFAREARDLANGGWNVLCVHQRGHGESGGSFVGFGQKERDDLLLWIRERTERGFGPFLIHGVSMGCATVAYAAPDLPGSVRCLVLDCGYESPEGQIARDCRKRHVPWSLMAPWVRLFTRIRPGVDLKRKTADALKKTNIPCLFLHGADDETVPCSVSRAALEACGAGRKCGIVIENAGHALAYLAMAPEDKKKAQALLAEWMDPKEEL